MGEFVLMNKYKQIDPNMMYGEMIKCVFVDAVEVKQQWIHHQSMHQKIIQSPNQVMFEMVPMLTHWNFRPRKKKTKKNVLIASPKKGLVYI